MNPRRVLFLMDTFWSPRGGTEGQIEILLERLPPRWEVEIWVVQRSTWLESHDFPCRHRSLGIRSLKSPRAIWRGMGLPRAIRRARFDLIQTFMGDASAIGPVVGRLAGVPVLVSRRDLGFWMTPFVRRVLRVADRLATGFVANCEAVKRNVVATEGVPASRVFVIRNGHDPAAYDGPRTAGALAPAGVPEGATVVCLAANWKPLKRQEDLVDAVARLAPRHPDLHALLLGEGQDGPIRARIAAGGVHDRVHLFHAKSGAVPFVRECHVGVLCSDSEGLSNAILEYMGCGLPVVASSVGGNPELVADGETGFLYPAGDVPALADRLDRLLFDPSLRARMGRASRARFDSDFTADRMVAETVALWDRVVSSSRA